MKELEIGIAKIAYDLQGEITSALFEPSMLIPINDELRSQLKSLKPHTDEASLKVNADLLLSSWFDKMNEIELADRELHEIASEVIVCEKYPNGNIKYCEIKYVFREVKAKIN